METGPDPGPAIDKCPRGLPVANDFLSHCWAHCLHKKKKKKGENWELAAPRASFIWSIFITGQQQSPLSACCQKASPCWKSPFLKGIMFAFLKKVASAAELLAFQTLGHWGRRGAQQLWSPARLVSGLLLLACQAALRIFPLPQDQPPLPTVCNPPLLLECLRFGERWLLRVLSMPSETLGPSLTSGLMRLWVKELVFGQRGEVGPLRGAFYAGGQAQSICGGQFGRVKDSRIFFLRAREITIG